MIQQKNFLRLSFCFVLFSAIAALLLGLGQESWYLPLLVCTCAISAYYCTDLLGLLQLPRYIVYAGMIGGALLAGYWPGVRRSPRDGLFCAPKPRIFQPSCSCDHPPCTEPSSAQSVW